jgi:hypothetical protein
METTHFFQSRGHDGLPSLLPCHNNWIDVVDVWARSQFVVSGVLHGLDGKKAEVPCTPHIIPVVGSKTLLNVGRRS